MGEYLWIILIIIFFILRAGSSGKKSAKNAGQTKTKSPAQPTANHQQKTKPVQQAKKPVVKAAAPAAKVTAANPVHQAAAPHVMAHQPTIEVSRHTHNEGESLDFVSMEGMDPCHEDELNIGADPCDVSVTNISDEAPASPGLQFNWSGNEMVRAIVMSEVLTRPCDRKR